MGKYVEENMGLAGINPVVGANQSSLFITQYTMPNTFTDNENRMRHFKYAISREVPSKLIPQNFIFTDENECLIYKRLDLCLEDGNISVFKCPVSMNSLLEIQDHLGKKVNENFLYETLTGKKLLCEDQLKIDPVLEEINLDKEETITESIVETIYSEFDDLEYPQTRMPIMNYYDEMEAEELIGDREDISIYESVDGYYAENDFTKVRTKSYPRISDIDLEVL